MGYIGPKAAMPILLEGLKRLENRGYDSAGIATLNSTGQLFRQRTAGNLAELSTLCSKFGGSWPENTVGIGHNRWATHGPATEANAHPHFDCHGEIALVHNGIVENWRVLKEKLEMAGHNLSSETDSELIAHLIEIEYARGAVPLEQAVRLALQNIEGSLGLAVLGSHDQDKIVVVRRGSSVLLGVDKKDAGLPAFYVASEETAILPHTNQVVNLKDGQMAMLNRQGFTILDLDNGNRLPSRIEELHWSLEEAERGGYPHFMLKEIWEQPNSLREAMRGRLPVDKGIAKLGGVADHLNVIDNCTHVVMVACGTSWHAAQIGRQLLEDWVGLPCTVEYASEFRYRQSYPLLSDDGEDHRCPLFIAISQSGETADTIGALQVAKDRGIPTMGIVNKVGSQIARQTDFGIYLHVGHEIGVASTRAFTGQVLVLAMFALLWGRWRGRLDKERGREIVAALETLPDQVAEILTLNNQIHAIAAHYQKAANFLYLGRGYNFPTALEGALKLKEISYIHAEGLPAAEMKHGPIALISPEMPVLVLAPHDETFEKICSNIKEIQSRGAKVIAITTSDHLDGEVEHVIRLPTTLRGLSPILNVIPLQLLAYHIAVLRGCNVDQPRHLAKSVTVE